MLVRMSVHSNPIPTYTYSYYISTEFRRVLFYSTTARRATLIPRSEQYQHRRSIYYVVRRLEWLRVKR